LSNLYPVKVVNKTSRENPIELKLEHPPGDLMVMGGNIVVPPQQLVQNSVLVELSPAMVQRGHVDLAIGVFSGDKRLATIKTGFLGPRPSSPGN